MYPNSTSDADLRQFLGADAPTAKCRLMLPHFAGPTSLAEDTTLPSPLLYRGFTFAERDSRAAFFVHSLIATVFDPENVALELAVPNQRITATAFLFGSRSNLVTQELLQRSGTDLFKFEFGPLWKIRCGGKEFSMPDPSRLMDPLQYENTTDYAVIAKLHEPGNNLVFVIAGLGGRATEGAAQFFVKNWSHLAEEYGKDDFAKVLKFEAPFQLNKCSPVTSARRAAWGYRYA